MSTSSCEKDRYLSWVAEEQSKGLVDIKFLIGESARGGSEEEVYKEANEIVRLHRDNKTMEHPGLL